MAVFKWMMKEFGLLLKAFPLVLLAACATIRGMGDDFQNLGKGLKMTMSEYERKSSPAQSSSQKLASTKSSRLDTESQTAEIRQAQERLRAAGFDPGPVDGILGSQTQAALREYQAANEFPTTGGLDQKTRNALGLR